MQKYLQTASCTKQRAEYAHVIEMWLELKKAARKPFENVTIHFCNLCLSLRCFKVILSINKHSNRL